MKYTILILFFLGSHGLASQNNETLGIQNTIYTFFDGFHARDAVAIQSTLHKSFELGSALKTKEGAVFQGLEGKQFVDAVIFRPEKPVWTEILGTLKINISGPLAHVWAPYEFRVDDNFSHCGVNSIHLIKSDQGWKILNITDSRLKQCD